jgi:hypothetical protein
MLQPTWADILMGDGWFGIVSNRFGFNVSGGGNQMAVVEATTNLLNWTAVSTNALDNGTLYFSDPDYGATPRRFYRARVWP